MNLKTENWKPSIFSIFYMTFLILSYTIEKEKSLNFFQIVGIVIILVGLFQTLVYFSKKEYTKPDEISFSFGVLYCTAGPIVAIKPYLIVDNYPIAISALVVLDVTLCLQCSMSLFRLEDARWKIHLALAVVPLLMGMVLILIPFEEKTPHNLFSFLLIPDAVASSYTILYCRGVTRRYGCHSEQILDISNQGATAHEVIDEKDNMVR